MNSKKVKFHPHCLLCGSKNPQGLHLRFIVDEDDHVSARFKGNDILQGYDGILHGGVIASLLDSAMMNCLFYQGIKAVTGELTIRYRYSVPCHAELELRARISAVKQPLFKMESELVMDGRVMAEATAKFMEQKEKTV